MTVKHSTTSLNPDMPGAATKRVSAVIADKTAYLAAVTSATEAADAYYQNAGLLMADGEYDQLLHAIALYETTNPEHRVLHSLHAKVAAGTSAGGDVTHAAPMLSLDNCFTLDELRAWLNGRGTEIFTTEPKYDGLSLAATYEQGRLVRIATRGDGSSGENVTHAAGRIHGLPLELAEKLDVEVRGEVIFTHTEYEAANTLRVAAGKKAFVNPRNAAAGTLRAETLEYPAVLNFYAHGQVGLKTTHHSKAMSRLAELGIGSGTGDLAIVVHTNAASVAATVERFAGLRDTLLLDVDGMVIKCDTVSEQQRLGFSSRAPRWGIAYKYPALEATSVLRSVEWTVGRTGRITPRATIDPVFVAGTTVTYATLHNADDIKRKDLRIGDTVLVKRAGEVIPRIESPIVEKRDGTEIVISAPSICPRCSGEIVTDDIVWRCSRGRACGTGEAIRYATSRDCLDIEGMGEKLVEQLVTSGRVKDVADLFGLTVDDLTGLERMGETSAKKVIEEIELARTRPLSRVFAALGVRMTGRSMSRRLARHFVTMDALKNADAEALCAVDGVGPERAAVIIEEIKELAEVIDRLTILGVNMIEPVTNDTAMTEAAGIAGKTFVVTGAMTGRLEGIARNDVHARIEAAGGKTSGSVSKKTDYLVTGEAGGSKVEKAQALGVKTITPDDLAELLDA
jgi:DNA ligase (NAD+)